MNKRGKNTSNRENLQTTDIDFGKKPTVSNLWDGCWNPAYRYKRKLEKLPHYPVLRIVREKKDNKITDIEIVFQSNDIKSCLKHLRVEKYNWVNPYFWIEQEFYPKCKFKRIEDMRKYFINKYKKQPEKWREHPLEEDFEIIFNDIWRICVITEGKAIIDQMDFTNYIWLIRYLVENTLVFTIDDVNYESWKWNYNNYLEEAASLFEKGGSDYPSCLKGQYITENDSKEKIKAIYISDIKNVINLFFNKVKPDNGLGIFLNKIYDSFAKELIKRKFFAKCVFCGNLFLFKKGKKYCSLRSEGKDCGTPARNKRYYAKHREKIIPRAKLYARKYRAE